MIKGIFILHRKPDMSLEEFSRYWKETHGPLATKISTLKKYIQNHQAAGSPSPAPCDGVAELWFDSPEEMAQGVGSPEGQATMADLANFTDQAKSGLLLVEEVQVV